jgi:hypothetical protein
MAPTSRRAAAYDAAICQGSAHRSGLERVYRRRRGAAGRAGENAAKSGTVKANAAPQDANSVNQLQCRLRLTL